MKIKTYTPRENLNFVGRKNEIAQLNAAVKGNGASIVVVYGRRRIGKTELIEQTLRQRKMIKLEGIEGQGERYQRQSLLAQIARYTGDPLHAKIASTTWRDVFELLYTFVKTGAWTLYFEEVQWIANYRDLFAAELKYFWDNFFRHNEKLTLVLCGSSPSFMLNNIVQSKALYNRSQIEIPLQEFSFTESRNFLGLKDKDIKAVLDAYLTVGGVPEYLKYLKQGSSLHLALCEHAFKKGSFFSKEWQRIFVSSFAENPAYKQIIELLATRKFSSRDEIFKHVPLSSGGGATDLLNDLVLCGFIEKYAPYYIKTSGKLIRYTIADNYMHFYLSFIKEKLAAINNAEFDANPASALNIASYRQWLGYAFERFCRKNHQVIADKLGFAAVDYQHGAFFNRSSQKEAPGFQIDLVFDRADRTITLCEIKYTESPATVSVGRNFVRKIALFPLNKSRRCHRVLISANGATKELEVGAYFDKILTAKDLLCS